MVEIAHIRDLREWIGQEVATSEWLAASQERISLFAEATDDHQWIHVDPVRAKQDSLYGTTIAHGFLLLSLLPALMARAIRIHGGVKMGLNYGLNHARFLRPVAAGAQVRARFTLAAVEDVPMAVQATWSVVLESQLQPKPCMEVEWLVRYYR